MTEKRKPWGKWYWLDWRGDARLRRCSYAARGLWVDLLSLMGGECDREGYLIMEGKTLPPEELAQLLGGSARDVGRLIAELEDKRVFSRVGDEGLPDDLKVIVASDLPVGTIFSRRMVRDKAKEQENRENGKLGGNPKITSHGKPPDPGDGLTPPVKAQKPEARSQRPDDQLESESLDAAQTLGRAFNSQLGELWPGLSPPPPLTAITTAKAFCDQGVPVAELVPVLEAAMRKRASNGGSMPRSLKLFEAQLNDAIARKLASPDRRPSHENEAESLWRVRFTRFVKPGTAWFAAWPTTADGKPDFSACPPSILQEFSSELVAKMGGAPGADPLEIPDFLKRPGS